MEINVRPPSAGASMDCCRGLLGSGPLGPSAALSAARRNGSQCHRLAYFRRALRQCLRVVGADIFSGTCVAVVVAVLCCTMPIMSCCCIWSDCSWSSASLTAIWSNRSWVFASLAAIWSFRCRIVSSPWAVPLYRSSLSAWSASPLSMLPSGVPFSPFPVLFSLIS